MDRLGFTIGFVFVKQGDRTVHMKTRSGQYGGFSCGYA